MLLPRDLETRLFKWLSRPEVILLLGARQVGKTSLIKRLRERYAGSLPSFFLDLEEPLNLDVCENVDRFINYLTQKGMQPGHRTMCFIDEIQHHPDPTKFLKLLEQTFTIARVRPFFANIQKELTKMPKLHFFDNGLRNAILDDFRATDKRTDLGRMAETVCFSELEKTTEHIQKINHWRSSDGKEIDFILTLEDKSIVPVEVKYRYHVEAEIPVAIRTRFYRMARRFFFCHCGWFNRNTRPALAAGCQNFFRLRFSS